MIVVGVEDAVTAAQTKLGAVEAAGGGVEVEAEAEVEAGAAAKVAAAVAVTVTVNPKTSGKTVRITKKITEITKNKMVLKLHRVHPKHIKTKSDIPAVLSAT